jgi:penicillin-insensitive murein endopeptidase
MMRAPGPGVRSAAAAGLLLALVALLPGQVVAQGAWARIGAPSAGPARVFGGYSEGCLAGAVALPPDGPGYQVVRPARHRHYGHPELVAFVGRLGGRLAEAGLGTALVGDMAQPRGGPISGHVSHETGLDVDIWLRLDVPPLPVAERPAVNAVSMVDAVMGAVDPAVWGDAQAELIRLAAMDPMVARIFVNPAIKRALCARHAAGAGDGGHDASWLRVVTPWPGHDSHMHVRLNCPPGDPGCESQAPPPPGTGCGGAPGGALPPGDRDAMYGSMGRPRPPGVLSPRCVAVYRAPAAR